MRTPHLRPPLQRRSRQTLDRILDAAARLLRTRSFDELTVADVASEARCSVGAFYGRFRDKEALLHALDERYFEELEAAMNAFVGSEVLESGTLREALESLASLLMRFHGRQQGLLRALILHARVHRDTAFLSREQQLWRQLPRLTAKLLRFRAELGHADPETAVVFAFLQMLLSLREMTLWPGIASQVPLKGAALARELARSSHAYLVTPPTGSPRPRRR